MNAPVAGFVVRFVILLVIEPPQLAFPHAHRFSAAHQHAAGGTLQHQVEAVAEEVIRPFVDMAKDLRSGLEAHDGGARQMAIHFPGERGQEGHRSGKILRYRGEAGLLVFVDVQIGPGNGGTEENGVGVPLHADFGLAAGIDQPGLFLGANFVQQRSDIDTGTDELEVLHAAFSCRGRPVCIIFRWWRVPSRMAVPAMAFRSDGKRPWEESD